MTVGNSMTLMGPGGSYKLYLTDNNNCESFYRELPISNIAAAVINRNEEKVTNDQCNLGKGSIKAPGISGMAPYYYYWSDSNGQPIGSGPVLENISAGNYSLMIGDAVTCSRQIILYTVLNEDKILSTPILNDLKICAPGDAFIRVMQPGLGTYVLYNENGIRLDQSASGTFKINIINSQNYFVRQVVGLCESPAARIRVTIENEGLSKLSNAISPNNDGLNDFWQIPDMINYPEGTVLIFNRYGQKVFASTGYKQPFDGRQNGKDLPVGTYYYIIDLKRACGLLKGSITIIR
jgi:gliding motility-associated-like protein